MCAKHCGDERIGFCSTLPTEDMAEDHMSQFVRNNGDDYPFVLILEFSGAKYIHPN